MGGKDTQGAKPQAHVLKRSAVILMSVTAGAAVANLYYSQPLLEELSRYFGVTPAVIGIAALLIHAGYAAGMLLIVPLGDMLENKPVIVTMLLLSVLSLAGISFAAGTGIFCAFSFLVGITSVVPQMMVPLAAHLAEPDKRGRVIGTVMSGLLIGILLSRTFSGLIGSALGWQAVYRIAAAAMAVTAAANILMLPESRPEKHTGYLSLISTLPPLLRSQPILMESSVLGCLNFAAFSIFWTTLSFYLKSPHYSMGAQVAGLFGLLGVAGALAASLVGRVTDRVSPRFTLAIAMLTVLFSFIIMVLFGGSIWGLIAGVIILDLGFQSAHVSNLARVHSLAAENRSRNNALYMFFSFLGGAAGAAAGSSVWEYFGWDGVCAAGIMVMVAGIFILYWRRKRK